MAKCLVSFHKRERYASEDFDAGVPLSAETHLSPAPLSFVSRNVKIRRTRKSSGSAQQTRREQEASNAAGARRNKLAPNCFQLEFPGVETGKRARVPLIETVRRGRRTRRPMYRTSAAFVGHLPRT